MTHQEHLRRQRAVLDTTLAILRDDRRVLAVGLYGSGARDEADAFSDIDLVCYLRDEERSGRQELLDRVAAQAPLLCRMWLYGVNALFLYEDGVRLDLDMHPPSSLRPRIQLKRVRILHDPDGVMATAVAASEQLASEAPDPKDPVEWCFWMIRQAVCWAKRGSQGGARSYDKRAAAVDSLAQLRDYLVRMRLRIAGRRDYLAAVDPEFARRLSRTFPRLETPEIIACAGRLLDECERICPDYCRQIGVPFPARGFNAVRGLVAEFAAVE